jgi:hypothetical protein
MPGNVLGRSTVEAADQRIWQKPGHQDEVRVSIGGVQEELAARRQHASEFSENSRTLLQVFHDGIGRHQGKDPVR